MPTYEYRCTACDHEFELFQSMSASHKRKCPECGRLKLERLIGTGAAVIFKGSGFYQTDYRSESYKKAAEKDKKAADGDKKSSDDGKKKTSTKAKGESSDGKASRKPGKNSAQSRD